MQLPSLHNYKTRRGCKLTGRVGRWEPEVSSSSSWRRVCRGSAAPPLCAGTRREEPTDVVIIARVNSAWYQAQDSGLSTAAIINICQRREMDAPTRGKDSSVCMVYDCMCVCVSESESEIERERDWWYAHPCVCQSVQAKSSDKFYRDRKFGWSWFKPLKRHYLCCTFKTSYTKHVICDAPKIKDLLSLISPPPLIQFHSLSFKLVTFKACAWVHTGLQLSKLLGKAHK